MGADSRVGLNSSPKLDTGGVEVRLMSEPIRDQGGRKEQEGRGLSRRYQHQGDPILNWLFPAIVIPPATLYCAQFSNGLWTLCSSGGVCTSYWLFRRYSQDRIYNFIFWFGNGSSVVSPYFIFLNRRFSCLNVISVFSAIELQRITTQFNNLGY